MIKNLLSLLVIFIFGALMSTAAFAAVNIDSVKLDGTTLTQSSTNMILDVQR